MKIADSVALVTGANRGLGLAFAKALVARGAKKVYATARDTSTLRSIEGVVPVQMDVNNVESVKAAAALCKDVDILLNNAGIAQIVGSTLEPAMIEASREIFETNYYGLIRSSQAFSPVILANGGGAILNVLSDTTWFAFPFLSAYSASKSAAWSYTNALRVELRPQGIQVLGLHVGFLDTDMTRGVSFAKSDARAVAEQALDALEAGSEEVLADEGTRELKRSLSTAHPRYLDPGHPA